QPLCSRVMCGSKDCILIAVWPLVLQKYVEEAKKKFQALQEAYSVLFDANKRFLYDVRIDDSDDDTDGMADFLSEMATIIVTPSNLSTQRNV
ncbi:DnaJ homolog subfamily B member 6-like isoform X3, partial [Tanacetum coccineum]